MKIKDEVDRLKMEGKGSEIPSCESDTVIRNPLKAAAEPDTDLGALGLSDIIDIDLFRPIMEDFNRITGIANAIIDIDGNVLAGAGWQDICTQFHRSHPDTLANCLESDTELSQGIEDGASKEYRCKNNLCDIATPIILRGRHLGNIFIGQYLREEEAVDETFFREQARRYGFEEEQYLEALSRVPRASRRQLDDLMAFFSKFAKMVSTMSLNTIQLSRMLNRSKQVEELSIRMSGDQDTASLCTEIIDYLCHRLQAPTGLIYVTNMDGDLELAGVYAHRRRKGRSYVFGRGEGLVGQAARQKKPVILEDIPRDYLSIESGLGEMPPKVIYLNPILHNDRVIALLELGFIEKPDSDQTSFLGNMAQSIATAILSAQNREIQARLLKESQKMTEKLKVQQEELQAANEELEEQTQQLSISEDRLKQQQEELQVTNEELEEQTQFLERNRIQLEDKNRALEKMQAQLTQKAEDLALSSRYKSEFLANMSHELRTPLNSLLLLAKILSENKEGTLNHDQVESAQVIYSSGRDLLSLINEILDLSKIEAGKMNLTLGKVETEELARNLDASFSHMAREKNLEFEVLVAPDCPSSVYSDFERVKQVLKNLIGNAVKFTSAGGVYVTFFDPRDRVAYGRPELDGADVLAVSVRDTGIGIEADKQALIFEAFQQSEGGISRRYGGTGLGLSICRELSKLLGGEIHLDSTKGEGATFTLYLPAGLEPGGQAREKKPLPVRPEPEASGRTDPQPLEIPDTPEEHLEDDRDRVTSDSKSVLIIEDDTRFGKTLMDFCRKRAFLCLYSATGENGLALARQYNPRAVILDIRLPGMDGLAVFDSLKTDAATRHIPVHFMSVEAPVTNVLNKGAIGYLTKPVSPEDLETAVNTIEGVITKDVKFLLVVEDNPVQQRSIGNLLKGRDININHAATGEAALKAVRSKPYDCVILDLGLPDMTGFELLERLTSDSDIILPPIIVYTGRDLSFEEEEMLRQYSESIIIKGVKSEERLLDETSLFLHRMMKDLPRDKKQMITDIHDSDQMFKGKTVLLVDDDMRNVFALSKVLAQRNMTVLKAENGQKAVDIIKKTPGIDLVLMDIMMPVMDGYEAMKKIRKDRQFAKLPIIALTAKAMKQDKSDCIEAGASDYLTKPVDMDRLLSMMRVWLYE